MLPTYNLFFESSPFASKVLKEIEKDFEKLREDFNNRKARDNLKRHIEQFTGLKDKINIKFIKNQKILNFSVIPIYNSTFFKKVEKNSKAQTSTKLDAKDREINQYVKKVNVIISQKIILNF